MKKILFITSTLFLLTAFACKKESNETVKVVRDCTGTYLRWNDKDYHVCNPEKVADFQNEMVVTATFKKIKECNGSANEGVVCMMYHQNEGWIEVEEIKD